MTANELVAHPWFSAIVSALVAILLAALLYRLGGALLLRMTRRAPIAHSVVRKCRVAARIVLPLMALQLVWRFAARDLPGAALLAHLNGLLLIACWTWLAERIINGFADGVIARNPLGDDDDSHGRAVYTQTRVLARSAVTVVVIAGLALMLMTFPEVRQIGTSLLASAGVIGIVVGLAAKPVFSNLIAGLQIAVSQPIRINDVLVVEGQWGRVEEITGTFVVVKLWDERNLVLPLTYFIEKPFENWTRHNGQLTGSVFLFVDYGMPLAPLRAELERVVHSAHQWDGRSFSLQVIDATERSMQLRILCTAANSSLAFDLRCAVREGLIAFMQRAYPQFLPQIRLARESGSDAGEPTDPPTPENPDQIGP